MDDETRHERSMCGIRDVLVLGVLFTSLQRAGAMHEFHECTIWLLCELFMIRIVTWARIYRAKIIGYRSIYLSPLRDAIRE